MKRLFVSLIALTGCGMLSPAVESSLNTAGIAILCSLQAEELDDPALNADCQALSGQLTPMQRAAIARHTSRAATRSVHATAADGGAP